MRDEHIPVTVYRVPRRLEQLEVASAEHGRQGDVHLRIRECHAEAGPRALSETDHIARQVLTVGRFGCVEPSLLSEGEAVREEIFVVRDGEVGHGDDGARRERV